MRKYAIVMMVLMLCMGATLGIVSVAAASPAETVPQVDATTSATPNYYRNFSEGYLKSIPVTGGYYSCLKNKAPFSFFWQDWYGVQMAYLLDEEVGLLGSATGLRLYASDGWSIDVSLDLARNPNSQGLYAILAWQMGSGGAPHQEPPLPVISASDGPFRFAYGQQPNVGPYNEPDPPSGGTPNYQNFLKMVRAIEVQPLPSGVTPVDPTTIPSDKIVVYGSIEPFALDSVVPASGPVGTEVTISGHGFYAAQESGYVSFGAEQATEYTSWDCQEIKCKVPAGVTGTVDVTVTNSEGTTNALPFTVATVAPTVTAMTPDYGVENSSVNITNLAGTGFQPGATVRIEQGSTVINAGSVTVVSDTTITCTLNLAGAPLGKYDVVVSNPDTLEGKLIQGFRVTNICGSGAGASLAVFGFAMGLLSIAGIGGARISRKRRK